MSHFEYLSNELIYEIFEYLDYFHVYQAFSSLNHRFDDIVFNAKFPIKINLSLMSKSILKHYNRNIIQANIHRIIAIHCPNVFMYDYIFSSILNLRSLRRLETLILYNIESKYLENLLTQLCFLSRLSSLVITSIDSIKNKNLIYRQIFRLSSLKYCQISLLGWNSGELLPVCMNNEYSPIESLVIINSVYYDQMDRLLSYVPQLRRLSLHALEQPRNVQEKFHLNLLNHVTHVSIKTTSLWFDHLLQLMTCFFPNIQVLHLTSQDSYTLKPCIDPKRWQQLIEDHLPDLRIFDIYIDKLVEDTNAQVSIETYMNEFVTLFWIKRQWFFTHHFYWKNDENRLLVYSMNPYRKKSYILCEQVNGTTCTDNYNSNLNSIQYIDIINEQSIDNCKIYFPNVTQLTFSNIFSTPSLSIMERLNRIVPLKQLTKLVIECPSISFRKLLQMFRYVTNVHTLELKTMTHSEKKDAYTSITQHAVFRFVSQTNTITNLTCSSECTLEQIQLLVALFPRIQYITLTTWPTDLDLVTRFLLDKHNPNTHHLCSLRFLDDYYFDEINMLIKSERLLDNYILMNAGLHIYLWW